MTKVKDIINYINNIAPFNTMEDWDNSGFLIGNDDAEISRCVLSLDATKAVVDFTVGMGAELILTHHPVIFNGARQIYDGSVVSEIIKNSINVVSAHTCFDKAEKGTNYCLAKILGLSDIQNVDDFVIVGTLPQVMSADDFAQMVSDTLSCQGLRYTDSEDEIKKVAICTGSGEEFLDIAMNNADCFLTGDAKYHTMLSASEEGFAMISAGHFETEFAPFVSIKSELKQQFSDVEFIEAPQKNPILAVQ